jgi:hypothetical protein
MTEMARTVRTGKSAFGGMGFPGFSAGKLSKPQPWQTQDLPGSGGPFLKA